MSDCDSPKQVKEEEEQEERVLQGRQARQLSREVKHCCSLFSTCQLFPPAAVSQLESCGSGELLEPILSSPVPAASAGVSGPVSRAGQVNLLSYWIFIF